VGGVELTLPDRVTVLTCIACGAMGRQEGCDSGCSEHKLMLVGADDYDELLRAARRARARSERLAAVARRFVESEAEPRDALRELRVDARQALRDAGPEPAASDWASPNTVTGWWCAGCGNVDMPQPCLGVCVWRPAEWVNLARYEEQLSYLRGARALQRFTAQAAAVVPREGQWERNWTALRAQARAALEASV
jgi:hypothetical protein